MISWPTCWPWIFRIWRGKFTNTTRRYKELAHNNFQIIVAPVSAWIPEHHPSNSHRLGRWWSIQWLCESGSYYGSIPWLITHCGAAAGRVMLVVGLWTVASNLGTSIFFLAKASLPSLVCLFVLVPKIAGVSPAVDSQGAVGTALPVDKGLDLNATISGRTRQTSFRIMLLAFF